MIACGSLEGSPIRPACDSCGSRPAGHGHFALYCLECAELPYGVTR